MSIEQYTESLVLSEMGCTIGKQSFGYVFPQGDVSSVDKIDILLKEAGGKPTTCELDDFTCGGKGKSKPEFIITFDSDTSTIIVVECKNTVSKHSSEGLNKPKSYAVDGVLYYAKYLKKEYNVIAVAVSGTRKESMKVSTYYWLKGQDNYLELTKASGIVLEPLNYLKLIKGEKLQKTYSLSEIRKIAFMMHESLREIKVTEKHKPLFIAGILLALQDESFCEEYAHYKTFSSVITNLNSAIDTVLTNSDIKRSRIDYLKSAFKVVGNNEKLKNIPLGHVNSITWYIEQLELKIKPMMNYADATLDALGVFYHEFVKYSGGDGSGLGIVLTPQHLTEFMCDLAGVNKNSKVVDICCGSGSFLVTAMSKMFKDANPAEMERIRKEGLYGVELDPDLYTLAIANMIIRKDGKSNVINADCFNSKTLKDLKAKNIDIGLINPPYSQNDYVELDFVEALLDTLTNKGIGVAVVPMSCAIGTKFKEVRERLFKKHTLKAVFSMPDDIFYPTGTNVCVMVWEAHKPHDSSRETFFGYYKNDGFVKRKNLGRVDANNAWVNVEKEWLELYSSNTVKAGVSSARCVTWKDEWLCEAYMETDYSNLCEKDFQVVINSYLAYLVKSGDKDED